MLSIKQESRCSTSDPTSQTTGSVVLIQTPEVTNCSDLVLNDADTEQLDVETYPFATYSVD